MSGQSSVHRVGSAATLFALDEYLASVGVDVEAFCAELGIERGLFKEYFTYLPIEKIAEILVAAIRASGGAGMGLFIGRRRRLYHLGVAASAMLSQDTVVSALRELKKYSQSINNSRIFTILEDGGVVEIRGDLILDASAKADIAVLRVAAEIFISTLRYAIEELLGRKWAPLSVTFRHSPPKSKVEIEEYYEMFGKTVLFQEECDSIFLSVDDARSGVARRDVREGGGAPEAYEIFAAPVADRVLESLLVLLPEGKATLKCVAQHIGLGERALQRRLAIEGTSFREILNDYRFRAAQTYLLDSSLEMKDIQIMLGFLSPSAFTHWYKDMTSTSPSRAIEGDRARRTPEKRRSV